MTLRSHGARLLTCLCPTLAGADEGLRTLCGQSAELCEAGGVRTRTQLACAGTHRIALGAGAGSLRDALRGRVVVEHPVVVVCAAEHLLKDREGLVVAR